MADALKFAEEGLKIQASIADKMDELMAAGGSIAISAPGVGTIIGAAVFVMGLIKAMGSNDDEIVNGLKKLQKQIDEIKVALSILDGRVDELIEQVAIESNRQTLRDLNSYVDEVRVLAIDLADRPNDVETAIRVANAAGIAVDKFLRSDFEIWRWTDVVLKEHFDASTGQTRTENALSLLRFKNIPTLPAYLTALVTWLAAREKVVKAGQEARLSDDHARLERHRAATATRPDFDKYRNDDFGTPQSIAEHIKWRIRAHPVASTNYPVNRVCQFYFVVGSMMTGRSAPGPGFDLLMPPDADTCLIDPGLLGAPDMEIDLETSAGVDTLHEVSELLGRLAAGGSLAGPSVGVFPKTEVFAPAMVYVIDQAANLQWYRNESAAARGGSKDWVGPRRVGTGWGGFTKVFSGGGAAIYAVRPDGDLLWYGHDGHGEGSEEWRAWQQVGSGWQGFRHVFSTGEYVIYGVRPDGEVLWYRHDGGRTGDVSAWAGGITVANGWPAFDRVFSGGDGVIYGIRPDGVLERRVHKGYQTGTTDWEPAKEIGTGWQSFREVVAAGDGVIYAFTRDGRILWYRYAKRRPPPPPSQEAPLDGVVTRGRIRPRDVTRHGGGGGGGTGALVTDRPHYFEETPGLDGVRPYQPGPHTDPAYIFEGEIWEGPVEIKRNFPFLRSAFVLMNAPSSGPN